MADAITLHVAPAGTGSGFARGDSERVRIMLNFLGLSYTEVEVDDAKLAEGSSTATSEPSDIVYKTGRLPALMVGDETVEGSGNILKYLGTRMDSERRDVGGRKVASICEWAITKHAELNGDFDDAALAATCTQIEIILNHDVDTEAGETFAGIAPSQFTFGDCALFELINAMIESQKKLKFLKYNTLKRFHDDTAQFDSLKAYIAGRN